MSWLEGALQDGCAPAPPHIVAFTHQPLFMAHPEEPDEDYPGAPSPPGRPPRLLGLPRARRMPVIELFRRYGVQATFCGHWHRNHEARTGTWWRCMTGSVGYPLGDDPSGIRVVRLTGAGVERGSDRFRSAGAVLRIDARPRALEANREAPSDRGCSDAPRATV